ncbi:MAG: hypothetical protein QMD06_00430 [Candidatus Altarchaeum sp.]|nr:hypothetical protein [Candidatus Altarchaeum sp.]
MENTTVSKISRDIKKKVEKKVKYNNIAGNLIKSNLETNIKKESGNIITKNLKTNLSEVMKDKATDMSYKLIKEKIQKNTKEGLAEYVIQKSKDVFDSITKVKKEEMKRKIDGL